MPMPCDAKPSFGVTVMDFQLEQAIDVLSRTPAVLRTLLVGLDDRWVAATEGPETFSPFDNVGHLIDGEETDWIPRARIILARGPEPRFEPYDRFRHLARNAGRSLTSLLDEFAALRVSNLERLRSWRLTDVELALEGVHPALGRVTLRQLLAAWVVHDLGHIAQVSRVMAKQYREAIGPWVPYSAGRHRPGDAAVVDFRPGPSVGMSHALPETCPTCGSALIQKSRGRLLTVGALMIVAAGAAAWFVPHAVVAAVITVLAGAYLVVWGSAGKGRWCRTCKRFPLG